MQYSLTGEALRRDALRGAREWDKYCDGEGERAQFLHQYPDQSNLYLGNLKKAATHGHAYPPRTIADLLHENSDLTALQVDRAAGFIGACLRLNPADRSTASALCLHRWLGTAFMGGTDD